jgi:hypothetical protein
VEALRQRGIDAEGIDLSSYAISHVHESVRPYCRVASITDDLPDRYDLIVSIEVLEHRRRRRARRPSPISAGIPTTSCFHRRRSTTATPTI